MKIAVKVKTGSSQRKIEKTGDLSYAVWVREVPEKGKANEAVVRILARHLKLPQSCVRIVRGVGTKDKLVEVLQ